VDEFRTGSRDESLSKLKILHIAPQNVSGVPGQWVAAERNLGYTSLLVTLFHDKRGYREDLCLELPFITFPPVRLLKRFISAREKISVHNRLIIPDQLPPVWQPHSWLESKLIQLRDRIWRPIIERAIRKYGLDQFDVYQLDGGLDFSRQPRFIPQMKAAGKKVICCYTGSDLRTRGVIAEIDLLSDLVVSVEYDHLYLHPRLHHVFFPFQANDMPTRQEGASANLRIGHAPTHRAAKGSEVILPILYRLAERFPVEIVLIENLPYAEALQRKRTLSIFIDQIGDLGYGINSLEALSMGIPTCSCLVKGFAEKYPDHPFIEINAANLEDTLIRLIQQPTRKAELERAGRDWVKKYHDPIKVVQRIHLLAGID